MADLSELLKEGTKESHDRAENTQFVKDFLKGNIRKELFKVCALAHELSWVLSPTGLTPPPFLHAPCFLSIRLWFNVLKEIR